MDSRSCRSAPSGFDGGKKVNGVKVHLGVDKYGIPLAVDVSSANVHGPWQRRQTVYEGHHPGAP
ncbi:transposase [Skermanella aerolata]|uniref:transposase n=1 Tax=Skermanella aerolata TaxID=393310 RepID=UPI00146FDEEC